MGKRKIEKVIHSFENSYKDPIKAVLDCVTKIEDEKCENSDALTHMRKVRNLSDQFLRATQMMATHLRLSNGLYEHNRQCIDIVRFVRGIVRTAAPYALKNGITFDYKLPPHPMITVTESEPLMTILSQLLSNACRFHAPGNQVSVDMYRRGMEALIIVWDRGPGISDNISPYIFDANFSYNPYGETLVGNGLGLTIAKQLAEFIGGSLNYGPNMHGSYFILTLPLHIGKRPRLSRPQIPKETIKIIMSDTVLSIKESEENNPEMQQKP